MPDITNQGIFNSLRLEYCRKLALSEGAHRYCRETLLFDIKSNFIQNVWMDHLAKFSFKCWMLAHALTRFFFAVKIMCLVKVHTGIAEKLYYLI